MFKKSDLVNRLETKVTALEDSVKSTKNIVNGASHMFPNNYVNKMAKDVVVDLPHQIKFMKFFVRALSDVNDQLDKETVKEFLEVAKEGYKNEGDRLENSNFKKVKKYTDDAIKSSEPKQSILDKLRGK